MRDGAHRPLDCDSPDSCEGRWEDPRRGCARLPAFKWLLLLVLLFCIYALQQRDPDSQRAVEESAAVGSNAGALSYTVYYTTGCEESRPAASPCSAGRLEVAEGVFDAATGRELSSRNLTKLRARRIQAVKASPDWRSVVFVASLANDLGNIYVVGVGGTDQQKASAVLDEEQLDALDSHCQYKSKRLEESVPPGELPDSSSGGGDAARAGPPHYQARTARLAGFKHLEVVLPDVAPERTPQQGTPPHYRVAIAFECKTPGKVTPGSLHFSTLAVVDVKLLANGTESELRIVDISSEDAVRVSQSCPRFVPSSRGYELLFAMEGPRLGDAAWPPSAAPAQRLALARLPSNPAAAGQARRLRSCCSEERAECFACMEGKSIPDFCTERGNHLRVSGCEEPIGQPWSWTGRQHQGLVAIWSGATFLDVGRGRLPAAPVRGCPEFMFSSYLDQRFTSRDSPESPDTFVAVTDLLSSSVLGLDGQVIVATLPRSESGGVGAVPLLQATGVQLLFNMDAAAEVSSGDVQLSLEGCRPIRSTTREESLEWRRSFERLTATRTAWFACIAADQRIVVAESSQPELWREVQTNSSASRVWCPRGQEGDCFDFWAGVNTIR